MHLLVELHGQPGWVAALTPLSVDGMIVAASTTLLADSRIGGRGGFLPRALLVVGSAASLAANVAVAEPTMTGRVIAAWPSFSLIAAYELLMRQVRRVAETTASRGSARRPPGLAARPETARYGEPAPASGAMTGERRLAGRDVRLEAWRWAQDNRAEDGSLPSGKDIGIRYGRHERWGRLVKAPACPASLARDSAGNALASLTRTRSMRHESASLGRQWDTSGMGDRVEQVAALLQRRDAIDADLAAIMNRPMTSGHLGEWLAARFFDIELDESASAPAIDGRFRSGPVAGRSVNVKWYLKREGVLDMTESAALDYYLVLAGPPSAAGSSRGSTRPWCIDAVYLFDARQLREQQIARGVKLGVASSVTTGQWRAAEVYPSAVNPLLPVSASQRALLQLFGAS